MKNLQSKNTSALLVFLSVLFGLFARSFSQTIVVNGDFSSGNTGFSTNYTYVADISGVNNEMGPEGTYSVGYNAYNYHSAWLNAGDHTTGTGQMLIVNGDPNTSKIVWQGTVDQDLVIGTTYDFSAYVIDLYTTSAHSSLTFKADGVTIGTLTSTSYQTWARLYGTFTATTLRPTLTLTNAQTATEGNDFAVDDINIYYEGTTVPPSAPEITTSAATLVSTTSATLGGNITADGGATVTGRGVVYSSTNTEPYINGSGVTQDTNGDGTGEFSESIGLLLPGTTYYFQAYAANTAGTSYGGVLNFTTSNATITVTDGSAFTPTVTGGSDRAIGRFSLTGDVAGANLTAASIKLNGTRTGLSNFKLWLSSDATFESGSDTQLGSTVGADPGDGSSVSFSTFTGTIGASATYFFLTADVDVAATGSVQGVIVANGNLTLSGGTLSGSIAYAPLSNGDATLPVELASFTASMQGNAIVLNWQTATETGNLGFILERTESNGVWRQIASYKTSNALKGHGNSSTTSDYSFTDNTVNAGMEYRYRLADVNTTGMLTMHAPISVTMTALPQSTEMQNAYPNPFNPETRITYQLHKDSPVTITVYDLLGRQVKTLIDEQQAAGSYQALWNGTDIYGAKAASGAYLVRMQTQEVTKMQKVLLLK